MTRIELLGQRIRDLQFDNGRLIVEKAAMAARIQDLEKALRRAGTRPALNYFAARDPLLGPEMPNGEGIAGEASAGIGGPGAGYHSGSDADPRD
jgi:hypothetical protein